MRRKNRTKEEYKILGKELIEYYFNNPHANSSKYMSEKFDVDEVSIRTILSKEFKRRYDNSLSRKFLKYELCNKEQSGQTKSI